MRSFIFVFVILPLLIAWTSAIPVYADNAEDKAVQISAEGISGEELTRITDGDYSTVFGADSLKLTFTSSEEIKAVYIIWNEPPEEYNISTDREKIAVGDGFLHSLTKLSEPSDTVTVENPRGGEICDIYFFKDMSLPDFVQRWEQPCRKADILVFSAHADDEFLMFGGTIPYYAKELDLRVQVVYMTTHWEEQPRPHELLDGLWAAGVENYPVFGIIPDIPYQPIFTLSEAAALYDFDEVLEWFTEQLRRFKPLVVISHDLNGEYGHAAHKLAAKTAADAVEISYDPDIYPESAEKYGVWDVPKTYLHFYGENTVVMDWEIPLESFGGLTAREAAALCYEKHKSQHVWGYSVNYNDKWDCRQFGLYRSLTGSDTEADFMENITPAAEEAQTEAASEKEETEDIVGTVSGVEESVSDREALSSVSESAVTVTPSPVTEASFSETASETAGNDGGGKNGGFDYGMALIAAAIVLAAVFAAVTVIKRKK